VSTDQFERKIICDNTTGATEALIWTGDALAGDLGERSPLGYTNNAIKILDFSDNPRLGGSLPSWLANLQTLENLNLARTNISGQLPRLDRDWDKVTSLNLVDTQLTGYVPALPGNIADCEMPRDRLCFYPDASWTDASSPACLRDIQACSGNPPNDKTPPPLPQTLAPHMEDVDPPYSPDAIRSIEDQCRLFKEWLVFHGENASLLWTDSDTCCPYWRDSNMPEREVTCLPWGISYISWTPKTWSLTGDINLPENTMSELKGLRNFNFPGQKLTGGFPVWATQITDLFGFNVANNSLSGPVLSMLQNGYFSAMMIENNNFSGPLPQLQVRKSGYGSEESGYGVCILQGGNSGLKLLMKSILSV
jgi:hypothetical protein